ncbi:MAG TPA: anthranilate phosphoribosyltransferase [Candidatus Acidoferrales bacterium]|jgi:anthranilate phosphoribosyltransferase|nr:anthranilate phosphoribosyltransferase [Candidatus Acidoferrales bacterium]
MMQSLIQKVEAGADLSRQEAENAMEEILSGRANEETIVALLSTLRAKGETVAELVGFARAMRRHVTPVFADGTRPEEMLVDTCGTGGDSSGTFNISTAAAFVVAGAGVRVAKHGNRSTPPKIGSADVLEALGISLDIPAERVGAAIHEIGIGFLYAPAMHTAMKHAMPARRKLGRTVFNLLGPLTNPAGARAQVVGVFSDKVVEKVALALSELDVERAFVVHGEGRLDEISLEGETAVGDVHRGVVSLYRITPENFGLERAPMEAIAGGDATENADFIRAIFSGERGPRRDIVIANAAAGIVAAGRATDFLEGAQLAATSIDSGEARNKLKALIAFTHR